MAAARANQCPKRSPLLVAPAEPGLYRIIDGNSTYAVALEMGWKRIPVHISS